MVRTIRGSDKQRVRLTTVWTKIGSDSRSFTFSLFEILFHKKLAIFHFFQHSLSYGEYIDMLEICVAKDLSINKTWDCGPKTDTLKYITFIFCQKKITISSTLVKKSQKEIHKIFHILLHDLVLTFTMYQINNKNMVKTSFFETFYPRQKKIRHYQKLKIV